MSNWLRRLVWVWALTACLPLFAQEFRAGITGIVKDSQGALMPGVPIEAENLATNEINRTTTNATGYYAFPVLPIGTYRVTAAPRGFKKAIRDNLELRVGDQVQQDFTLEVGAVTDQVTVTAGTDLLQTVVSDKGQVVGVENVSDTPSVGRNPYLLGVEATGVQFDIGANALSRSVRPFDAGNNVAESMSINGGRTGRSDLLLDGVTDTGVETGSVATNMAFVPNQDAVSEFRIENSNYDAQYGRTAGGTITLSTKNGTNQYHGAAYWYVKNTILTANTFDQNRVGGARAAYHQQEPGVELDGPVVIPHIYDGHNKTFFMYSYELWRDEIPSPVTSNTPQTLALQGNFSTTLQSNGTPITVYDPLSVAQTGSNTYTRQPFPNDTIPQTRFNPVGAKIASYNLPPNVGNQSTFAGQTNNLVVSPNARTDAYDAHVLRVDQTINDKERFFSRFVRGFRTEVNNTNGFQQAASPQYTDGRLSQGGNVDLTSILSPTTMLTSRLGYLRHDLWITLYASGFDPTTLGFPASLLQTLPPYFPAINDGYTAFGAGRSAGNQFTESASWSWSEIVNKTIRRHQIKFGGEFRVMLNNIDSPTSTFGSYTFNAGFTQFNALSSSTGTGNGVASLLLGLPASGSAAINAALAYGYHYYGTFVQDDWRVTNKLTLSLGLRWDYESPVTERNNQINAGFNLTATSPLQVADSYQPGVPLTGGLLFTSPGSRMPYGRDLNNFQPRAGFAWHPWNKTVIRAGYGLSYLATFTTSGNQGFSISTPVTVSNDSINLNGTTLSNPFPTGILTPTGSKLGLSTFLGQNVTFVNPSRVIPRVHEFSIGVQHELPGRSVVEVSYVGSRSQELDVSQNINAVTMAQLLQYGGSTNSPNLTNTVTNPFAGLLPGTSINGATTTLQQLLLPHPQFGSITEQNIPVGKSWYNSIQLRYEKRLTHGLNVMVNYTYERWLDATSYLNAQDSITQTPERTLNATDTPHRIVVDGNWAIPFFANTKGVVGALVKGWQLNGIFVRESGFPLAAPSGFYSSGINPELPGGNVTKAFNTCTLLTNGTTTNCTFNGQTLPVAFIQQQPNTPRVLSLEFPSIRPPKVPNADVSMFKAFTLREHMRLQFRAEAFNTTNSPQFNTPNTGLSGSSAGLVTLSQVNDPRNVQLSLRLMF
jgi:hypothetical protein